MMTMSGGAPLPPSGAAWRDILTVTRFELIESLRTRRVVLFMLLFLASGGAWAWGFAHLVEKAERAAAEVLAAPTTQKPGTSLDRLRKTPMYRNVLENLVDDPEAAKSLEALPPLVVVFAWLAMTFGPALVLFCASGSVADEVGSRGVRYSLLRTGRTEYVLGKFCGQLLLLTGVVGLSGITFFAVSWSLLASLPVESTVLGMLRFWPWVVVDVLPYLGLAFLASMLARGWIGACTYSVLGALGLLGVHRLARWDTLRHGPIVSALLDLVDYVTPVPRNYGVLAPLGTTCLRSVALCLGLTALYLGSGLVLFRRRDL
jgi:ABC-type transport system involved in multi-copper enzyme maturation permease subunit